MSKPCVCSHMKTGHDYRSNFVGRWSATAGVCLARNCACKNYRRAKKWVKTIIATRM